MHEKGTKVLRFTLKIVKLFIPDGLFPLFSVQRPLRCLRSEGTTGLVLDCVADTWCSGTTLGSQTNQKS